MQARTLYIQTLKVGLWGWFAGLTMWALYISGTGEFNFPGFFRGLLFYVMMTLIPVVIASLIIAKLLLCLKIKYDKNWKANTVGIVSTMLLSWIAIVIVALVAAVGSMISSQSYSFRIVEELYGLRYVIFVGTVMGSWAIVALGVWQGHFLKTNSNIK
jgi:hypothetical protein